MKKIKITEIAALIIWLLPIIYFIKIYTALPPTVPLHFNWEGMPDRYGSKNELIISVAILSIITIGIYFLIKFLPKIDPKKTAKYSTETFKKISFALVVFLSALELFIIHSSLEQKFSGNKFFFPLIGLFFAYLGNLMHSIKSNYFVGICTPWTLEDPDTWRATHQLGGKLWFVGGILITITTLLLPHKTGFVIFISTVLVMSLIPLIYSYLYYKKHKH